MQVCVAFPNPITKSDNLVRKNYLCETKKPDSGVGTSRTIAQRHPKMLFEEKLSTFRPAEVL